MPALRTGELGRLQHTQTHHMMDKCKILVYSAAEDAYNIPQPTYTPGSEIVCGFDPEAWEEVQDETETPLTRPAFRLPFGTAVNAADRILLTRRFGAVITAETYEVVGGVERGPSGLVVKARLVTDGS